MSLLHNIRATASLVFWRVWDVGELQFDSGLGIELTLTGPCLGLSSEIRGSPRESADVLVEAAGIEFQSEK
jgi:hypothetical protein